MVDQNRKSKYDFYGTHVLAEFYEVPVKLFGDDKMVIDSVEKSIKKCGLTQLKLAYEAFLPEGFTLFVLLRESHISIHAYPEHQAMFIDAFTCGAHHPKQLIEMLKAIFCPKTVHIETLYRGKKHLPKNE